MQSYLCVVQIYRQPYPPRGTLGVHINQNLASGFSLVKYFYTGVFTFSFLYTGIFTFPISQYGISLFKIFHFGYHFLDFTTQDFTLLIHHNIYRGFYLYITIHENINVCTYLGVYTIRYNLNISCCCKISKHTGNHILTPTQSFCVTAYDSSHNVLFCDS